MPREYRHIKDYEREIEELRKEGYSSREIGIKFGFSYKQMRNYFYRHNVEQRKIAAGIAIKGKGRPPKDYVVSEQDKVAEGDFYNSTNLSLFGFGLLFLLGSCARIDARRIITIPRSPIRVNSSSRSVYEKISAPAGSI